MCTVIAGSSKSFSVLLLSDFVLSNILSYIMLFLSLGEMSIGEEEHLDEQAINDLRNST